MRIERYSPELHEAFVKNAIRRRARDWPYTPADEPYLLDCARQAIVSNPRGALVGVDDADADLLYGYVLVEGPQAVCMAYTKQALRGPGAFGGTQRDPGCPPVCSGLLEAAGVDISEPISVRIWSVSASRIAARGYRIYPAIPK